VEHTPVKEWETTLKRFYAEFIGNSGSDKDDTAELQTQNKGAVCSSLFSISRSLALSFL